MNHFYRNKTQVSQEASKLALSKKIGRNTLLLIITAHTRYQIKAEIPQII